jgi:hypothetical protein
MNGKDAGIDTRGRAHTYTAGHGAPPVGGDARRLQPVASHDAPPSRTRRFMRRMAQRVAVLVALLVLFYATSLHGISVRTLVLAVLLMLSLYWVFQGWLKA